MILEPGQSRCLFLTKFNWSRESSYDIYSLSLPNIFSKGIVSWCPMWLGFHQLIYYRILLYDRCSILDYIDLVIMFSNDAEHFSKLKIVLCRFKTSVKERFLLLFFVKDKILHVVYRKYTLLLNLQLL